MISAPPIKAATDKIEVVLLIVFLGIGWLFLGNFYADALDHSRLQKALAS